MTNSDVIRKLVGRINPVGETNQDNIRFENLGEMCNVINSLILDIELVLDGNKDADEYSRKRAALYCQNFINELKQRL